MLCYVSVSYTHLDVYKRQDSIEVEGWQRVNFPHAYGKPRCLQMLLLLKGKSPLLLEDMRSLSCSPNF